MKFACRHKTFSIDVSTQTYVKLSDYVRIKENRYYLYTHTNTQDEQGLITLDYVLMGIHIAQYTCSDVYE